MFRIITLKEQKFSQSDPVLIRQFKKKLQSDPVLSGQNWFQFDPVLSVLISARQSAENFFFCQDSMYNGATKNEVKVVEDTRV